MGFENLRNYSNDPDEALRQLIEDRGEDHTIEQLFGETLDVTVLSISHIEHKGRDAIWRTSEIDGSFTYCDVSANTLIILAPDWASPDWATQWAYVVEGGYCSSAKKYAGLPEKSVKSFTLTAPTVAPEATHTPSPSPSPSQSPSPSPSPTPTPTPASSIRLPDTTNGIWLKRAYPGLARQVSDFPWVADGLTDAEERTLDDLLYVAANDLETMRTVVGTPWVQDSGGPLVYAALRQIKDISSDYPHSARFIVSQPFLNTLENDDVLALKAAAKLAHKKILSTSLINHPAIQDGLTDDETARVAAAGTLYEAPDKIEQVLSPDQIYPEVLNASTSFTPDLRVSIFRFCTQSRPRTVETIVDAVAFVETVMEQPLPASHVVVVLTDDAVPDGFAGANYGFAVSFSPDYEEVTAWEQRQLQAGMVHEVSHYFWAGNEDWINEGLAKMFEVIYGVDHGLSRGQLRTYRGDCEAHDLEMRSAEYQPDASDLDTNICDYYLGQLLFEELFDSVGQGEFRERLRTLYPLTVEEQEADLPPGIGVIRRVFSDQTEIVEKHWSGKLNAPENRGFDEGYEYVSHHLVEWEKLPTFEGGYVQFKGRLLGDAILNHGVGGDAVGKPQNFVLRWADSGDPYGNILPPLSGNRTWNLSGSDSVVASTYLLNKAEGTFNIKFQFAGNVVGDPANFVVTVKGYQDDSRTPTIGERIDNLGYARIRAQ